MLTAFSFFWNNALNELQALEFQRLKKKKDLVLIFFFFLDRGLHVILTTDLPASTFQVLDLLSCPAKVTTKYNPYQPPPPKKQQTNQQANCH